MQQISIVKTVHPLRPWIDLLLRLGSWGRCWVTCGRFFSAEWSAKQKEPELVEFPDSSESTHDIHSLRISLSLLTRCMCKQWRFPIDSSVTLLANGPRPSAIGRRKISKGSIFHSPNVRLNWPLAMKRVKGWLCCLKKGKRMSNDVLPIVKQIWWCCVTIKREAEWTHTC